VNARLRAAGITVHEAPGWQNRGNGYVSNYVGGLVHHTATGFGKALPGTGVYDLLVNGRSDLDGPLCNYAGNDDGSITIIAANPANHAGASGGRSMGPLPVTKLFNPRVLGLEIVYPGTVPMRAGQYRSALVWARAVADVVGGGDIDRVRAHAETSITGKWDPGYAPSQTIDMAAFRRDATNPFEEDFMAAITDSDQQALIWRLEALVHGRATVAGGPTKGEKVELASAVAATRASVSALTTAVAALANDPDLDPVAVEAILRDAVKDATPTAAQTAAALLPLVEQIATEVLGADNQDTATEILRQLRAALPEGN
jgi:hypothetical protein